MQNTNTEIIKFESETFGSVRTILINDEPWFVGKDVTEILGYQNASKALSDHVDYEDKLNNESLSSLGQRGGWLINESGLYSLILSSKLPKAKEFKHWVTSEVLPSLRKHGGYIVKQEELTPEEFIAKAVLMATNILAEKEKEIERKNKELAEKDQRLVEQQPFVEFANHVSSSENAIDMNVMAKLAAKNGINIGRNRMIKWLKREKVLLKDNTPYQAYIEKGLFKVIEVVKQTSYGPITFPKTLVTGKGQIWIIEKLRKSVEV